MSGIVRTGEEMKKKWCHVKSEAKVSVVAARKGMCQTGGGEMVDGVKSSQQRILDVIGEVCVHGIDGGIDIAETNFLAGILFLKIS